VATYHEAFWVVTGTAAPVIALAVIVALPSMLSVQLDLMTADELERPSAVAVAAGITPRKYLTRARAYSLGPSLTLTVQTLLLLASLVSIAGARNWVSPWLAGTAAVGGVFMLGSTAVPSAILVPMWRMAQAPLPSADPRGDGGPAIPPVAEVPRAERRSSSRVRRRSGCHGRGERIGEVEMRGSRW
jgi:hypothetical protein